MALIAIPGGGSGTASDECTATKNNVLPGYTAVTKDSNDEPIEGTMPIPRNSSSVTLTTADLRKVIAQDATSDAFWVIDNSDGTKRALIKIPHEGYYSSLDIVAVRAERMANAGGLTAAKLMKGQTAFGITGTATSDANATSSRIYNGYTAYVNGTKITGNMTCNSILNFSAQTYSTSQVLLKWQNPYAANGKPFSGVFINYSTSGYPGTGGTRIYTGYGNNTASGGWSQVIVSMPSAGTRYYFSCTAYCSCSSGDLWGNTLHAYADTVSHGQVNFTSSTSWTVPAGIYSIDIFCVGGGGGGGAGEDRNVGNGGGGGGGGYTSTARNVAVIPGQVANIIVGFGGGADNNYHGADGGTSSFAIGGITKASANGGKGGRYKSYGGNGGSGGGGAGYGTPHTNKQESAGSGGADGSDGTYGWEAPGTGQHTTTRAFGESNNTLYAGGGGGGMRGPSGNGYGGAGGGGKGATAWDSNTHGTANTGGGGGGAYNYSPAGGAGVGGSGVVIVRW